MGAPNDEMPGFWPDEYSALARGEGWDIWSCSGSSYGEWQVCRVDSPDVGEGVLSDDEEAWRIAMSGKGLHHQAARKFIEIANPAEFERMACWYYEQLPKPAERETRTLAVILEIEAPADFNKWQRLNSIRLWVESSLCSKDVTVKATVFGTEGAP